MAWELESKLLFYAKYFFRDHVFCKVHIKTKHNVTNDDYWEILQLLCLKQYLLQIL